MNPGHSPCPLAFWNLFWNLLLPSACPSGTFCPPAPALLEPSAPPAPALLGPSAPQRLPFWDLLLPSACPSGNLLPPRRLPFWTFCPPPPPQRLPFWNLLPPAPALLGPSAPSACPSGTFGPWGWEQALAGERGAFWERILGAGPQAQRLLQRMRSFWKVRLRGLGATGTRQV
ncbi:hypothetical protein QTO34_007519 [Cnephaeus nilssonii]|uniref:Uncharacterized protein n=1 Tax=Cnephaeus nilssonii TaxID=3371016 RepID=A0AA40LHK5_CNENI|nr:hypothetical protein QTO34_007519 [Eptesicus nilssonii]